VLTPTAQLGRTPGPATNYNSASWAWNFGGWDQPGAVITQMNYRDNRRGSHICLHCTNSATGGDPSCSGNGGCDVEVYCLK
jgi:hypothetical protein